MFKVIKCIINLLFLIILGAFGYFLALQPEAVFYALDEIPMYLSNVIVQYSIVAVIIIYFIIIILSYVEKLVKRTKKINVKGKNGTIEINVLTLENISKAFLESKNIIKSAKVKVETTMFGKPIINATIENYRAENLSDKLANIKNELEAHVEEMVGIKPSKINLNVNKINSEFAIEEVETENVVNENFNINEEDINID